MYKKLRDKILNKKTEPQILIGTVYSLDPFKVTLVPSDTPIPVVASSGLYGVAVGSRVVLQRFLNQFIAIDILGSPKIDAIEIGLTSDQSITTTDYTVIAFDTETIKIGNNLTFESANKCIYIGAGIKSIEVNSTAWAMQYAAGYSRLFIYKNGSNYGQHILPPRNATSQYWASHTLSQIISVTEGDRIYSKMNFGTANGANYVEGTQTRATHMSVKVLEYDF